MSVSVVYAAQLPHWTCSAQCASELQIEARVECDLLIWFAAHPAESFALYQLESRLTYSRAALGVAIRNLAASGVIEFVAGRGRQVWRLTPDPSLREFVCAVADYLTAHPEIHSLRVRNGTI